VKDLEVRPGPGNYEQDSSCMYMNNPSFSIARKYKPNSPDEIPGPNNVIFITN